MNTPVNTPVGVRPNDGDEDVILGDILRTLIEEYLLVLGIAFVVILFAVIYVSMARPIYSADAVVQVEQADPTTQSLAMNPALSSLTSQTIITDAEIQVMQSRDVLGPVVNQFKLNFSATPRTLPILGTIAERFHRPGGLAAPWFGLRRFAWGGEQLDITTFTVPRQLENQQLLFTSKGSGNYELRDPSGRLLLTGRVGQLAKNGDISLFVKDLVANDGTEFYVVRANELDAIEGFGSGVQVAEQGKQTGVIAITLNGTDPVFVTAITNAVAQSYLRQHIERKQEEASKTLQFLDSQLPQRKRELEAAEAALSTFQQKAGTFQPSAEAQVYLGGVIDYERQLAQLQLERVQLLSRFTAQHPMVRALDEQIGQLEARRQGFEDRFRKLPVNEATAVGLERNAKVSSDVYVFLLNKAQELSLTRAGTIGNVRILDDALVPSSPIKPKKSLIITASVFLGLILGALAAFAKKQLLTGLMDPQRIERNLGLPIFGVVSLNQKQVGWDEALRGSGPAAKRQILAITDPKDYTVEALRSFRTSLQFGLLDAPNNIVEITGPIPGTGKSFVSINLATLLAESGKRVLLVDADMRRGHVNEYFGKGRGPGLSEALSKQVSIDSVITATEIPGLSAVFTGSIPPNPSELLMSPHTRVLFESLAAQFDIVLVDTPPVLAVTDASIITGIAGSTFFVLRAGLHSEREIAEAMRRIAQGGGRLSGAVFNGVKLQLQGYGRYAYGYQYNYGYEYDSVKK